MLKTLALLAFIAALFSPQLFAQAPPSNASQLGTSTPVGWPQAQYITIYIDANYFPPGSDDFYSICDGYYADQTAYGWVEAYDFVSTSTMPTMTSNMEWVTAQVNNSTPDQYGSDVISYYFNSATGLYTTINAIVSLDTSLIGNEAGLVYAASHEETHNNNIGDCPTCSGGSTIMSYNIFITNPPIQGPTQNDIDEFDYLANFFPSNAGGGGNPSCDPEQVGCPDPN